MIVDRVYSMWVYLKQYRTELFYLTIMEMEVLFTRDITITLTVSVKVTVKVITMVMNTEARNGYGTHTVHQSVRHH